MKRIPYREIIGLFIATRLLLIVITYIAYILLNSPQGQYPSTPVDVVGLFSTWNRWDAVNYVRIAQYGYGYHVQQFGDLNFFPLFPFLIFCLSFVLGSPSWSYLLIGTLISNLALLGTLFLIYRLAADAVGDEVAYRALLYLCIFPTALFFFAAYNESLYLLLVAGAFLAMQKQHWWLAGLLGLLASLTRSAGLLLVVPYLYELWIVREQVLASWRNSLVSILPIVLIPIGIVIYALYCWWLIGDPLAFLTLQVHSGRHLALPWYGIWQSIVSLFFYHIQPFGSSNEAHILLDLSATLSFTFLTLLGWRTLRKSYSIWMAVFLVYILLEPATDKPNLLLSSQRFVLEMFPAFFTLALLSKQHPRLHQALILIFPTLLAVLSIGFLMNKWVV